MILEPGEIAELYPEYEEENTRDLAEWKVRVAEQKLEEENAGATKQKTQGRVTKRKLKARDAKGKLKENLALAAIWNLQEQPGTST